MLDKKLIWRIFLWLMLLFFTYLMVKLTLPYLAIGENVAFLRIKRTARTIPIWQLAFYIHVFTSVFLLIAGFTQFSNYFLKNYKRAHRWIGKSYVFIILFLSAPSGLIMSFLANGGLISKIAFTTLTFAWLITTAKAWQTALNKDFQAHKEWMIRSFALTLSALTLRAWKYIIAITLAPPPMDMYRAVAWLGWIPNLLLAEWIIRRKRLTDAALDD
jgi:hypothetical protein